MSRPCTIEYSPSLHTQGNDEIKPSATPYEPSDGMAMETQSPSAAPSVQDRMWSMAALAADAADEAPRASMMAAPRLATVGMKPSVSQPRATLARIGEPSTRAWVTSGYIVGEWLPQMARLLNALTGAPSLADSC